MSDSFDLVNARLSFQNGCIANLTASRISDKPLRKLRLFEKNQYVSMDLQTNTGSIYNVLNSQKASPKGSILKLKNKHILLKKLVAKPSNALFEELVSFINSIQNAKTPTVSAVDGKKAIELAILIKDKINEQNEELLKIKSEEENRKRQQEKKENQRLNPISFYGRSKLAAEEYIKLYPTKGTTKVILRLFNVYGPGTDKNNKKHGMVGIFFNQAIKNKEILVKGSLSRFRDFIYVDDVIEANIDAMDPHIPRGVFDVGTANPVSFEEFVSNMGVKYDHTDPSDIPSWYQYYTKADENKWLPGWSPQCDIVEGCKKYLKYLNH